MFNTFGTEPRIPETLRIGFVRSYKKLITTHFRLQELIYFGFHREHFWLHFVDRVQCVTVEGRKRSAVLIVWKMKYCGESRTKRTSNAIGIREANWIGHYWRRNCFLNHAIIGKIGEDEEEDVSSYCYCKEMIGWWKLKWKALECAVWRTPSERGCEPVVRLHYDGYYHCTICMSPVTGISFWYFSWTSGDPHRSRFKLHIAVLSVLCVMFQV